jgi:hypothetical protein
MLQRGFMGAFDIKPDTICSILSSKVIPRHFVISGGGGAELVGWTTPPQERGPWSLRAFRIYRLADLKGGSGGQTYRQGCNRPLRVPKAGRHHGTLLIAQANRLLLLSDQDAYTGPTIMPQSRRGSRAQGHNAHILCGEWIPRLEVISNELCACVGPGKSIG